MRAARSSAAARATSCASHQADLIEQSAAASGARHRSDRAGASSPSCSMAPIDDVRLEIGFGGGEHLIAEAQAFPNIGFIGCEPYVNGMAKILTQIEAHNIGNIRLYRRRRRRTAGLGAAAIAGADRPDPSRSLAEAAALEAALRAGRDGRRDGAHSEGRRRISFRQRHRRLLRLDAGASDALRRIFSGPRSAPSTGASRGTATP